MLQKFYFNLAMSITYRMAYTVCCKKEKLLIYDIELSSLLFNINSIE